LGLVLKDIVSLIVRVCDTVWVVVMM